MGENSHGAAGGSGSRTRVERRSDCDLFVIRSFDAPVHLVFDAWTTPEHFMRWWAPRSTGMTIRACDMDVRTGGGYRLEFAHPEAEQGMAFFGKYIEVIANQRLVWTNEESEGGAVTTVTFEAQGDRTLLVLHEHYPSKEALDEAFVGMESCMPEQFEQLDDLLPTLPGGQRTA